MQGNQVLIDYRGAKARQDEVWQTLRAAPAPLTCTEIHEKVRRHQTRGQVDSAVQSLMRAGRIEIAVQGLGGAGRASTYRIVEGEGTE